MFMQSKYMYIIFSFRIKLDELLMSENAFRDQCNVVKKKKKDPTGIIRRTATGVTNSLDFRVKLRVQILTLPQAGFVLSGQLPSLLTSHR